MPEDVPGVRQKLLRLPRTMADYLSAYSVTGMVAEHVGASCRVVIITPSPLRHILLYSREVQSGRLPR